MLIHVFIYLFIYLFIHSFNHSFSFNAIIYTYQVIKNDFCSSTNKSTVLSVRIKMFYYI